ncbi:MAG: HDOD domain-containing protein [Fibrobacterales bacterium]
MSSFALRDLMIENMNIPTKPDNLVAFLNEASREEPSIQRLEEIIQHDAAICVQILKTVNSSYFALAHDVSSIQQAIMIMGLNELKNLVYCFTIKNTFSKMTAEMDYFWDKAQQVAYLATQLAKKFTYLPADEVFSLAYLCNTGVMPIMDDFKSYYSFYTENEFNADRSVVTSEDGEFRLDHAVVGGFIAKRWGLPTFLRVGISAHHSAIEDPDSVQVSDGVIKHRIIASVALIHCAEYYFCKANKLPTPFEYAQRSEKICSILSIDKKEMEGYIQQEIDEISE